MKNVAAAAGVSQSTVSFVLNGVDDIHIAEETRQRVFEAAQRLGYRRRGAGRPSKHDAGVIAMMVDEVATSPFAAISIEGAQERAWQAGCILQVAMTGGDADYERALLEQYRATGVTGIIYASILTRLAHPPEALAAFNTVLLNAYDERQRFASIVPDDRAGSYAATDVLIRAGRRRIAMIGGEDWMDAARARREGFVAAMRDHGLLIREDWLQTGNFLPSGGRRATLALLDGEGRPDAIVCANDLTAVGCYEALKERGLCIPDDIAVVGYDDQEIAEQLAPALTTVLLPHREMGQWCVDTLLAAVAGGEMGREQRQIDCPLVVRHSHAP